MIPAVLHNKSNAFDFTLGQADQWIESYHKKTLEKISTTDWSNSLSPIQRLLTNTLRSLVRREDWVVKPADKNLGTCIMDRQMYIHMCMVHLSDTNAYEIYRGKPDFKDEFATLYRLLEAYDLHRAPKRANMSPLAASLLQLDLRQQSSTTALRKSQFYVLPKMHKKLRDDQDNIPGRPIVSSINSGTYFASKYLHNYLMQLSARLPSICRSSIEALQAVHNLQIPEGATILCADVASLYPSIPTEYGLKAVKQLLHAFRIDSQQGIEFHLHL